MALDITDSPPAAVRRELAALRDGLDERIPSKEVDRNLLIGTWNIRMFGSVTKKWTATSDDSPKRDYRGLLAIAEVISRFDVVAIQEIMGNMRGLRYLLRLLGPNWSFLMTDETEGAAGNNERMAFLFDTRRVALSGLACELVIPEEWIAETGEDAMNKQFARTPYGVSFRANNQTFILVSLHVKYGNRSAERIPELKGIARWLADWADRSHKWHHNLICLGDFNIDRKDDPLYEAFTSTGLVVPSDLHKVKRSIFADDENPQLEKYYDQIAWFSDDGGRKLTMNHTRSGGFDFLPYVYTDQSLSRNSVSFRLSDHYPLWSEFSLRD